ncbi:MAG: hypothetical protein II947_03340 [Bacteroidaceae bacterium]|nr:hypothetical protein [Bacteroidaceae bacterium]
MKSEELNYHKLRKMIVRCKWTFAKTMPFAPHEYIVRDKCPLTDEEFVYFVDMQRRFGVKERWGKYNNPYLYIDDYKYWTMGAPIEETKVINRAKACVVEDVQELHNGIEQSKIKEGIEDFHYVEEYISKKLGLIVDNKAYNIELINGRLKEISNCVSHLERMRANYCCEIMKEWSEQLSVDYPRWKKCEDIHPTNTIYTGICVDCLNIPDAVAVRIQMDKGQLYYGLTYMPATKEIRNELQEATSFINDHHDFIRGSDWLYYKYTSFEDGHVKLKQLIEEVKYMSLIIKDRDDAIWLLKNEFQMDVYNMTDEEVNDKIRDFMGIDFNVPERTEFDSKIIIPKDTEFSESHKGPTPSGGDYSIAYFYDDDGCPCEKSKATMINIVEYKKGGIRINEHYGYLGGNNQKE